MTDTVESGVDAALEMLRNKIAQLNASIPAPQPPEEPRVIENECAEDVFSKIKALNGGMGLVVLADLAGNVAVVEDRDTMFFRLEELPFVLVEPRKRGHPGFVHATVCRREYNTCAIYPGGGLSRSLMRIKADDPLVQILHHGRGEVTGSVTAYAHVDGQELRDAANAAAGLKMDIPRDVDAIGTGKVVAIEPTNVMGESVHHVTVAGGCIKIYTVTQTNLRIGDEVNTYDPIGQLISRNNRFRVTVGMQNAAISLPATADGVARYAVPLGWLSGIKTHVPPILIGVTVPDMQKTTKLPDTELYIVKLGFWSETSATLDNVSVFIRQDAVEE